MRKTSKQELSKRAKPLMYHNQSWKMDARNGDKTKTDRWYKDQPEEGTDEATAKAKRMTPGQRESFSSFISKIDEEAANSISAGTIPNTTENPEGSRKKKKWHPLTRHYIEIGGKRRKLVR
jgi:hypothetical protein